MLTMFCLSFLLLAPLIVQDVRGVPVPPRPAPPWVVVDSLEPVRYDLVNQLQLVVLSDGTYVGYYQHTGHYGISRGTHFLRSRDRGMTWNRVSRVDLLHVSLIEHDDVLWLLGIEGERTTSAAPLAVMCSRDGGETWVGGASRLRGEEQLRAANDTLIHAGRVWRSFSRSLISEGTERSAATVFVASAALDANLQDPRSWRWSSELSMTDVEAHERSARFLVLEPNRGDPALVFSREFESSPLAVADVEVEGGRLKKRDETSAWLLPSGTWGRRLSRDEAGGSYYHLAAEAAIESEPADNMRRRAVLALRTSDLVKPWNRQVLLHDDEHRFVSFGFGGAFGLIEGDDLAVLFSFSEPAPVAVNGGRERIVLAFLRVPKFRERTSKTLPLWGPAVPR